MTVVYLKDKTGWKETKEYEMKQVDGDEPTRFLLLDAIPTSAPLGSWIMKNEQEIYLQKGVAKSLDQKFILSSTKIKKKTNRLVKSIKGKKEKMIVENRIHYTVLQKFGWINSGKLSTVVKCPLHDDHNPSAMIYIASGSFRCFACGVFYKFGKFFTAMIEKYSDVYVESGQLKAK